MVDQQRPRAGTGTKSIGMRIGEYQLGETIGKGGFGCVYKALDQQAAHIVAIKQVSLGGLHSGDISSIEVEIELLSKLKHKNIVKYIHSIRTDTHLNIVLEYVEGGSIASILRKFGAFPESLCAIYTLQILRGLKFLHSQGVIHRDIKGANVLSTKTGIIKLADFGVATKLSEIDSSKRRVVGTPYWMAPETVEIGPPTAASDIWSVGSTVVEMVTKNPPYAELPQLSALYKIVADPHPPLPEGFSEELERFLLKCFEKSPIQRPGAAVLLEDPWIQGNKRHLRINLQPKEDVESGDSGEELEVLTTSLQESVLLTLRPKDDSPSRSSKSLKVSKDLRSSGSKDNPQAAGNTASTPNQLGSGRTRSPEARPSIKRTDPPAKKLLEVLPVSYQENEAQRDMEERQGYHFAFLDYYRRYCEVKTEDPESVDSSAQKEEESLKPPLSTPTLSNPLRDDEHGLPDREQQRLAAEVKNLLARIRPFEEPSELVKVCQDLIKLLAPGRGSPETKESVHQLVMQHGAVPIVEMLQVPDAKLQDSVLKVVNQIVADRSRGFQFQELFSMVGLIPEVLKLARTDVQRSLRQEVGRFISHLCNSSESSLQMLVACGGLEAIVELISSEYFHNPDLVFPALDNVKTVLDKRGGHSRDLCRILAKRGICEHLVQLIDTLASDMGYYMDRAAQYLHVVVSLLVFFAKTGDAVVKAYMAKATVLEGLVASMEFLPPELILEICKIFTELTQEPSVLNMMENSGLVPVMVHHMTVPQIEVDSVQSPVDGEPQDVCSQCLLALSNLCKLSRPRQEQAALAGAIPKLQIIVERQHPLREHAFAMLCDMTCTSQATRSLLWNQGCAGFLVRSLAQHDMQVPAMEALVGWFAVKEHRANWCQRLEQLLLKGPDFFMRLLNIFKCQDNAIFLKVLDPLLKLVTCSPETNAALANSDEFLGELLRRLETDGNDPESSKNQFNSLNTAFSPDNLAQVAARVGEPVRRLISAQPDTDEAVRARQSLLRLLMQLCQHLSKDQLAMLVQRFRLKQQLQRVLAEEKRRQRVILSAIAHQLLVMFQTALPDDGKEVSHSAT